jgi:hypothetical protein
MAGDGGGGVLENTLRAQKADGAIFQVFCEGRGYEFHQFPSNPFNYSCQ